MPFEPLILVLTYVSFMAFAAKRLMTYLHIFQQEEYDEGRFLNWMFGNLAFDKRMSAVLFLAMTAWLFTPFFVSAFIVVAGFAGLAYIERDPRKVSKKKLAMTQRAARIYFIALCLSLFSSLWIAFMPLPLFWLAPVQLLPFALVVANVLLAPFEKNVQKKFHDEAYAKIRRVKPTVIGVTGSFGKTSVKHILGHILQSAAPTLVTPGSVNTPMGIARIVREDLEERHKYFIVEMGAYGPGSIDRLCKLTDPDLGIITAIGHAHYERFKSLETVAATKYELAATVLHNSGEMIVHEKTLAFPAAQAARAAKPSSFIVCGESKGCDLVINDAHQDEKGLDVTVTFRNEIAVLRAPLYGLHHAQNMALAFAAARALNIPADRITTALKSVPQIAHRLEVKRQGGNILIDDAYNSNPQGFRAALELLGALGGNGRKILITPGMVELGAVHDEAHYQIGQIAGEVCDVALIVAAQRIPTFVEGFKERGGNKILLQVPNFSSAQEWLTKNGQNDDVILIENDLPDLYESKIKL